MVWPSWFSDVPLRTMMFRPPAPPWSSVASSKSLSRLTSQFGAEPGERRITEDPDDARDLEVESRIVWIGRLLVQVVDQAE